MFLEYGFGGSFKTILRILGAGGATERRMNASVYGTASINEISTDKVRQEVGWVVSCVGSWCNVDLSSE